MPQLNYLKKLFKSKIVVAVIILFITMYILFDPHFLYGLMQGPFSCTVLLSLFYLFSALGAVILYRIGITLYSKLKYQKLSKDYEKTTWKLIRLYFAIVLLFSITCAVIYLFII